MTNQAVTLENIATEMKTQCLDAAASSSEAHFHIAQRRLPRGLILALELSATHWQLSLSRANIQPSEAEIDTCAGAFDVPEGVATLRGVAYATNGTPIEMARLRWSRYEQLSLEAQLTKEEINQ